MGCILYLFFGIVIFIVLMFMFVCFVYYNILDKKDILWLKNIVEVLKGNEYKVVDVGKYNVGQKMMFWFIMSMIFVLLVIGVIIWCLYFVQYFFMQVVCYSLLIYVVVGIILMYVIFIYIYMVFWVKGLIKGMIEGKVSCCWVKKYYLCWYCEIEKVEVKKEIEEGIQ